MVVRRFGFLKQNEKDFVSHGETEVKRENAVPRLKSCCLKTLEHQYIESLSLLTIGIYSIFILFDLTMTEQIVKVDPSIIEYIDFVFLVIFLVEIGLKTFASSGAFLLDGFNVFDATIVTVSFVLNI